MKKLFLFVLTVFVLVSCSPKYPRMQVASTVDYSEYMKNGFFITESNSVSFDYKPVGNVSVLLSDGWEVIKGEKEDGFYTIKDMGSVRYGMYFPANRAEALQHLVEKAKEMGADGVINLKFEYVMRLYDKNGVADGREYVRATGMAIKQ